MLTRIVHVPTLKAHTDPSYWSENLPLVLLGIRTVLKRMYIARPKKWSTVPPSDYKVNLSIALASLILLTQLAMLPI